VGRIEDLADRFQEYIAAPWQRTLAGSQRVVIVVYEKELERTLRARWPEFEQRTRDAGHAWAAHDVTRSFAEWLAREEYCDAFFEEPKDLAPKLDVEFREFVAEPLRKRLRVSDENSVVALHGVASLYGFASVSALIHAVEQEIRGRLVVFFPGSKDGNDYRLLDARDGWNYLAASVTLHGMPGKRFGKP
jgi:hypothetical protein